MLELIYCVAMFLDFIGVIAVGVKAAQDSSSEEK